MTVDVYQLVAKSVAARLEEKGARVPALTRETRMMGGELALDSLDIATILIDLQEQVNLDPFADGFIEFRTIGELVDIYKKSLG